MLIGAQTENTATFFLDLSDDFIWGAGVVTYFFFFKLN